MRNASHIFSFSLVQQLCKAFSRGARRPHNWASRKTLSWISNPPGYQTHYVRHLRTLLEEVTMKGKGKGKEAGVGKNNFRPQCWSDTSSKRGERKED